MWGHMEWYSELFYEKSNANKSFDSEKLFGGQPMVESDPMGRALKYCSVAV